MTAEERSQKWMTELDEVERMTAEQAQEELLRQIWRNCLPGTLGVMSAVSLMVASQLPKR